MTKTIRSILALAAAAALLIIGPAGCGMDFEPASYLNDARVLAIGADPLEVGPGEQVTLRPVIFLPDDLQLDEQTWSYCPFSLGAQAGYECAVPACQLDLTAEPDGSLVSDPLALALECVARFEGQSLPQGVPSELPESIEAIYTYRMIASDGSQRQAVARVPMYPGGVPEPRNRPPVIAGIEIGGQPATAGELLDPIAEEAELSVRVLTDPDSLDAYQDASGRDLQEDAIVSLFATAGRFDFDRAFGTDVSVPWKAEDLEPGQTQADIYAVVRDLRGGQAVAGPISVPILR